MIINKIIISGSVIAILSSSALLAAGKGSNPNGKPFIEIQGQFVEVVERIDNMEEYVNLELLALKSRMTNLEADVDSIGSRVLLLEQSIVEHQAVIATTESKIDTLIAASILENQAVADAMVSIESLEAEIAVWNEDPIANEVLISAAEAEIMAIRNLLTQEVEGLQVQVQKIENNSIAINNMQNQLDGLNASINNANDLTPQCPNGILTSNPDGSAECTVTGTEGRIATTYFSAVLEINALSWEEVTYSYGSYMTSVNYYTTLGEPQSCPETEYMNIHPAMLEYVGVSGYYYGSDIQPQVYYNYDYDNDIGYTYQWYAYNNAPYKNTVRLSYTCYNYYGTN